MPPNWPANIYATNLQFLSWEQIKEEILLSVTNKRRKNGEVANPDTTRGKVLS